MKIKLADLEFEKLIEEKDIANRIAHLGEQISIDYKNSTPIFIGVLSGSFLFIADLVRQVSNPCEVTFTKLASYYGGTASSGDTVPWSRRCWSGSRTSGRRVFRMK